MLLTLSMHGMFVFTKCVCLLTHVRLFTTPMDYSPPGSSIHGILQTRILPFPSPGDLPDPGIEPVSVASPVLAGRFFTTAPTGKPATN